MSMADTISSEMMEECLVDHLVLAHNISPDQLIELQGLKQNEDWLPFLVRGHYILHMIDRYGEYHDSQFDFYRSEQ